MGHLGVFPYAVHEDRLEMAACALQLLRQHGLPDGFIRDLINRVGRFFLHSLQSGHSPLVVAL